MNNTGRRIVSAVLIIALAATHISPLSTEAGEPAKIPVAGVTAVLGQHLKEALREAEKPVEEVAEEPAEEPTEVCTEEPETEPQDSVITISAAEFYLLTVVVEAEAGICGEECRRAVASTILNRAEETGSITEAVYAPEQFSCIWDGGVQRTSVIKESTIQICREEIEKVTYPELWFFRTNHYHERFGTPAFALDNMYFSTR